MQPRCASWIRLYNGWGRNGLRSGGHRWGHLAGPRAAVLAEIDGRIANLDRWQKAAAIEMPEARSESVASLARGKRSSSPGKPPTSTPGSQTGGSSSCSMAERCMNHSGTWFGVFITSIPSVSPIGIALRLQHARGARIEQEVYTDIAAHVGVASIGIADAKKRYEYSRIFEGACSEVLSAIGTGDPEPLYDAVLMDEAQDLRLPSCEMVFRVTTPPKRIVWAYDDLQNLGAYRPTSPARLFGLNSVGQPNVPDLAHDEGDARADIILPVCYRNTGWALTTAHAVGLGVYRRPWGGSGRDSCNSITTQNWKEIGYVIEQGAVSPGERVTLVRGAR